MLREDVVISPFADYLTKIMIRIIKLSMISAPLAQNITRALATLVLTSIPAFGAFTAIGFEGQTIDGIPYSTATGIPNGVAPGSAFSYTFLPGNNLQNFNDSSKGIIDSDDGSSGGGSVPDYYKSSQFGWRLDGHRATSNTQAGWNTFDNTVVGNGASGGTDYPGGIAGRQAELGEAFNVNHLFSPATGNLAKAPGLGDQFLDVHGKTGFSAQMSLDFTATTAEIFYITMGFGGRDSGSQNVMAHYRLLEGSSVIFSGTTGDTPYEAWAPTDRGNPSAGAVAASLGVNPGVTQQDWEYFKHTFSVTAGHTYTLQVMLPEELNFDFALGSQYTHTPGIQILPGFGAIPEPSAALLGVLGSFLFLRRKRA